jgi:hypothetical protein
MISDDWWIEEGAQYDLPFITMISGASFLIITLMTWLSLFGYLAAQGILVGSNCGGCSTSTFKGVTR